MLQLAEEKEAEEAARAKSKSSKDKDGDRGEGSKDDPKGSKGLEKTSSTAMANGSSEKVRNDLALCCLASWTELVLGALR